MLGKKSFIFYTIAFILYTFAALFVTYPLILHLGNFTTGYGDELFIAWTQNWIMHSVLTGNIGGVFNANLYYPFANTLAYSDLHLVSALLSIIPTQLINEPIVSVNTTLISSLVFLGFSVYLLVYYLTRDFYASLLSGALILFSPAISGYYVHVQMLAVEWIPISLLFFIIFIKTGRSRFLFLSLLFFILQTYNSFLPGYFIMFSYLSISIWAFIADRYKLKRYCTINNLFIVLGAFLLLLPIILPYLQVAREFHYARDIRDSIHFSLQPEDLLYASAFSRFQGVLNALPFNRFSENGEFAGGFVGLLFSLLIIFTLFRWFRFFKKNNVVINSFVSTALFSLLLSFGPVLHLGRHTVHIPYPVPLPYFLFYYLAPGFTGFRTPLRWEMLFMICMAVVVAMVTHTITKKWATLPAIFFYIVLITVIFFEYVPSLHFVPIDSLSKFPSVYRWLAKTSPDAKIIEMPIYNWNTFPFASIEQMRDYYSIANFRRTVNGASGFSPPPWQRFVVEMLEDFPNTTTITELQKLHITYIIVHKNEYDAMSKVHYTVNGKTVKDGEAVLTFLNKKTSLHLIKHFQNDFVYKL